VYDFIYLLLSHLLSLIPLTKEAPYEAYKDGGRVVVCIQGLSTDLEIEAIDADGYYLALDRVETRGSAHLRQEKIHIPKKTQAALLIEAGWAREVKLYTNHGVQALKVQRHGRCPHVEKSL
jgi:hypothetical protein